MSGVTALIAAEMERCAADIEALAVQLIAAPGLGSDALVWLQAFDELAQRQREMARLLLHPHDMCSIRLEGLRDRFMRAAA